METLRRTLIQCSEETLKTGQRYSVHLNAPTQPFNTTIESEIELHKPKLKGILQNQLILQKSHERQERLKGHEMQ